jgi:hypothetical protein
LGIDRLVTALEHASNGAARYCATTAL